MYRLDVGRYPLRAADCVYLCQLLGYISLIRREEDRTWKRWAARQLSLALFFSLFFSPFFSISSFSVLSHTVCVHASFALKLLLWTSIPPPRSGSHRLSVRRVRSWHGAGTDGHTDGQRAMQGRSLHTCSSLAWPRPDTHTCVNRNVENLHLCVRKQNVRLKGTVHPEKKTLSSFTYPYDVPNTSLGGVKYTKNKKNKWVRVS